jgi:hypothetical protein
MSIDNQDLANEQKPQQQASIVFNNHYGFENFILPGQHNSDYSFAGLNLMTSMSRIFEKNNIMK